MLVRDLLKYFDDNQGVTFIKARARKDANTPFYHAEYQTTPINSKREWLSTDKLLDYIVLNDNQPPIDWLSGVVWTTWFNRGTLESILIISEKDLYLLYPNINQRTSMINYIDKKIIERRS